MNLKRIYLFLLFILIVQFIHAQINPPSLSNLRKKSISTSGQTIKLDSLSLIPGSVIVEGVSPYYYKVDEVNGTITWLEKPNKENVIVTYRIFPYKLNAVARHLNYDSIRYNFTSLKTPASEYLYNIKTGEKKLLKQQKANGHPSSPAIHLNIFFSMIIFRSSIKLINNLEKHLAYLQCLPLLLPV